MSEESPDPGAPDPGGPDPEDGLDLARRITRSLAGAGRAAGPRRRTGAGRARGRTPRGAFSTAHPDERDPQTLESSLGRLVRAEGWEVDLKVHSVFGRWADLVGAEVAAHVTPEAYDAGRLVVRTDSTAWATQLKLLAPALVRRLNTELGHGTITAIEILGPHLPNWSKGRRSMRDGRGPRDTYG